MRKSSKVLAVVFLLVAGGLVFWTTRRDAAEIEAAVVAQVDEATADRRREIEEELAEQRRQLENEFADKERELQETIAQREQALADTLAAREQAMAETLAEREQTVAQRMAELDAAMARLEHPVYFRIHADTLAQVLRRMGLTYEQGEDNDGEPKFEFKLATYTVTLFTNDCEENACTNLRIYAGFNTSPSEETILEWGRNKRYATAYLNNDGKARLDNDLIIKGGITLGAVEAFILNFRDRLGEFADHIDF